MSCPYQILRRYRTYYWRIRSIRMNRRSEHYVGRFSPPFTTPKTKNQCTGQPGMPGTTVASVVSVLTLCGPEAEVTHVAANGQENCR